MLILVIILIFGGLSDENIPVHTTSDYGLNLQLGNKTRLEFRGSCFRIR